MRRTRFTEQQIVGGRIKLNPGYRLRFCAGSAGFRIRRYTLEGKIQWAERLGPEALEETRCPSEPREVARDIAHEWLRS